MRVEGLLDQLVAAPDLFDFDGADLGSTKAQLQFPVRRAPETGRTDELAVAFVHALRKGQEQGQQAYLFPDVLIKLEEQRDFLGGPLTVEERQRRYELEIAQQDSASCPECWIDWQVIDAAGQEINPMRKQFYNLCQQSFWLAMQAGGEDETSDRIAQITDNHP